MLNLGLSDGGQEDGVSQLHGSCNGTCTSGDMEVRHQAGVRHAQNLDLTPRQLRLIHATYFLSPITRIFLASRHVIFELFIERKHGGTNFYFLPLRCIKIDKVECAPWYFLPPLL